jgi:hypothetical protein
MPMAADMVFDQEAVVPSLCSIRFCSAMSSFTSFHCFSEHCPSIGVLAP